MKRRQFLTASLLGTSALAAPSLAQGLIRWTLVTSWARNQPGPGTSAARLANRINAAAQGKLQVELRAAGELVGPFEVLSAVSQGSAQMGHTASLFWTASLPAAFYFSAVPFGMGPRASLAWLQEGGGQTLYEALYAPFGVLPLAAGNSGPTLAGWFKTPLRDASSLRGVRVRAVGLGAEVLRRLGASVVALPPSEIFQALESGAIDAAEFLGPFSDAALGLEQAAPYAYGPSFNKPNGGAEALINQSAWEGLPSDMQALVRAACLAENAAGLAEADALNAAALERLLAAGLNYAPLPADLVARARGLAEDVKAEAAEGDAQHQAIRASYQDFSERMSLWQT